jgi:hypothetical protein
MAKSSEYEHHQPRAGIKKKQKVYNEEAVLESRGSRVSFKNYIRQLREEEIAQEGNGEEYAVHGGIIDDGGDFIGKELAVFVTEDEAQDEVDRLYDLEPEGSSKVYRVIPV